MSGRDAIDVALRQTRQSTRHRNAVQSPLPDNMIDLIRVAVDHAETLDRYCKAKGLPEQVLRDAARYYLHKTILESGDNHHRTLALSLGATAEQVRDHKRLLLKWLHPDRNHNSWESGLFLRVQEAARQLERTKQIETLTTSLTTPVHRGTGTTAKKRGKPKPSFRLRHSDLQSFMRVIAMPALTIAGAAAMIYVAITHGSSGVIAKDTLFSLLHWRTQ
jgi:AraC-like DNA-binding protein